MSLSSLQAFGVLQMPTGNLAAKQQIKAAGCTHTVIQAQWSALQPSGAGTALNSTAVASLIQEYADAATAGLKVMLEVALQYPPSWVLSGVESFKDQFGNVLNGSAQSGGQQVSNWMWTSAGWGYVSDFVNKLGAALGSGSIAQTSDVKIGGGYYGELHYPISVATAPNYSFWGYGTSMQTGTGLASGQVVCPNPGYTIFSGTDAQDSQWLNWYLNGLGTWIMFFIGAMRTAGWTACDYHVCHTGYGIRSNEVHSSTAYQSSAGTGEDPARMIGVYAHDPKIWPYCTWMNTADGYDPVYTDTDISAWKKIYEEAYLRGKHYKLWGENTGGENTAGLQAIFSGGTYGSALSGATYAQAPPVTYGFQGIFWLQYSSLTGGVMGNASLSDYTTSIASFTPTITASGNSVATLPTVPTNSVLPAITGTTTHGNTLTCSTGTWTQSPTSYSYQWVSGVGYVGAAGVGQNTYVLQVSDEGNKMKCIVTASNAVGIAVATSAQTATVN
jgi:hypothetical protein